MLTPHTGDTMHLQDPKSWRERGFLTVAWWKQLHGVSTLDEVRDAAAFKMRLGKALKMKMHMVE